MYQDTVNNINLINKYKDKRAALSICSINKKQNNYKFDALLSKDQLSKDRSIDSENSLSDKNNNKKFKKTLSKYLNRKSILITKSNKSDLSSESVSDEDNNKELNKYNRLKRRFYNDKYKLQKYDIKDFN